MCRSLNNEFGLTTLYNPDSNMNRVRSDLLLWADRRPVERRGVLMITNFVILGLMSSGPYAVSAEFMSLKSSARINLSSDYQLVLLNLGYCKL
jgi:hypothetical protein